MRGVLPCPFVCVNKPFSHEGKVVGVWVVNAVKCKKTNAVNVVQHFVGILLALVKLVLQVFDLFL